MKDKITVNIACYSKSNPAYLEETIASIRAQGLEPVAIADERITAYKWDEAIENCKTPYLHLAHHDDVYMDGFYAETVAFLDAHPDAAAVFTRDYLIDEYGNRTGETKLPDSFPRKALYDFNDIYKWTLKVGNILRCETVVFNVEKVRGLKYPHDECNTASDTGMWFLVASKHPIGIIDKPLVRYRSHPDSDTQARVVGSGYLFDSFRACEYGASLVPQVREDWKVAVHLAFGRQRHDRFLDMQRLKDRQRDAKSVGFIVVHEPPDNAGTGVLAAHRVREYNRRDDGRFWWYVHPSPQVPLPQEMVAGGVPRIVCPPEQFPRAFSKYKPTAIEYHHLLRWPLDILTAPIADKSLYLHDSYLWCAAYHSFDGEKVCNEPKPEKCARCVGTEAVKVMEKRERVLKYVRGVKVFGNSDYTCHYGALHLGVPVIRFGVEIPPMAPAFRGKRVGYFGGFYPVKGVDTLLCAALLLPDVQFLMFCDMPEGDLLEGRGFVGLDNVLFMGRYERADMPKLVNLVDAVVVPSRNESFGLVAREARGLGVPVVATRTGGLDGTVEPGYPKQLADAIRRAL